LLALSHLRGVQFRRPLIGIAHGLIGFAGLCLLILALQGPRRGDAMGVGSFGTVAAVLFGVALTFGPFVPLLMKRSAGFARVILAAHATIAITGFVLFLAWFSFG